MKAIGSRSLSSVLNLAITVGMYAVGFGLALMGSIVAISLFSDFSGIDNLTMDVPVSVRFEAGMVPVAAPWFGIDDAELHNVTGEGVLKFRPPNRIWPALTGTLVMAALSVLFWILAQLKGVFRTLIAGQPFVAANAVRIRRIGYAVIVSQLGLFLLQYVAINRLWSRFTAEGLAFDVRPDLNVAALAAGVIILVIAEVFRAGTRLDEEQSLTV